MIRVWRDGGVAVVALNRPEHRNAMTPEMFGALGRELDGLTGLGVSGTAPVSALVLTGEGKVFCGGFDLKLCLAAPGTLAILLRSLSETIERLRSFDFPVVVAAQGAAIAGGCALLAAADVVVTNAGAKLGYPVTPLGISPAVSAPTLAESIGDGATRTRLLDPWLVSGSEALRMGLVHECVSTAEEVLPRAVAVARELAAKPAHAFAATKRWFRELGGSGVDALRASLSIAGGAEERERLAAFLGQAGDSSPGSRPR
jgi:enoyl-CoA hydratase/carnithine racemase